MRSQTVCWRRTFSAKSLNCSTSRIENALASSSEPKATLVEISSSEQWVSFCYPEGVGQKWRVFPSHVEIPFGLFAETKKGKLTGYFSDVRCEVQNLQGPSDVLDDEYVGSSYSSGSTIQKKTQEVPARPVSAWRVRGNSEPDANSLFARHWRSVLGMAGKTEEATRSSVG